MRCIIVAFIGIFAFSSCGEQAFFDENVSVEKEAWSQSDTLELKIDIEDVNQKYDLFVNIRNNKAYKYMNVFMFLDIIDPDGELWHDTLAFQLADESGAWRSEDVSETYVMSSFSTYKNYNFPKEGTYKFRMIHGMYDEPLKGIADVGIKLKTAS